MIRRLACIAAGLLFLAAQAWADCAPGQVHLRGDWGETRFTIELADTPEERAQGLMFRESLPRGAGMLFVYERPQRARFWMKNTLIPLDMIFADPTGVVTAVHHRAVPGDLTGIDGGDGVLAVLEINGGLAETYGIEPGTVLRHPAFSGGPPAWPC
jgi:uncharacterized membrane protein (UPF0127 family)